MRYKLIVSSIPSCPPPIPRASIPSYLPLNDYKAAIKFKHFFSSFYSIMLEWMLSYHARLFSALFHVD